LARLQRHPALPASLHTVSILDAKQSGLTTGGPSFSLRNRLIRALWIVVWLLGARWTPRQLHPWRRFLLRSFGASMAPGSDVRGSATVWLPSNLEMHERALIGPGVTCYCMGRIVLGHDVIVSQRAHLCAGTHDYNTPDFQLQARPISIGAHAWVAAEAFVGPGAVIGEGVVLGARAVALGKLEPWTVYSGNPAQPVRARRRAAFVGAD